MLWFRIDNRLIHGQVIETWLPYTQAGRLLVANDGVAEDTLQQSIMSMAVPGRIKLQFVSLAKLALALGEYACHDTLVLFANCCDARRAYEMGVAFSAINVGNLHYGPGKRQICTHAAVSAEDADCLNFFKTQGIKLDFRCVPNDNPHVEEF